MSMSARLKSFLDENHVHYTPVTHSPAYTAQMAAHTMHIPGKEMAKTVVVRARDETVLAVLPASCHVNLTQLGKLVGGELRLATEPEFIEQFPDCELGAMPPFGNLYRIPVYVDEKLAADHEIVFNAGTHHDAIRMRYVDFVRLAHPAVGEFAEKG